jgi:uncharacterized protein (DUF433 family)
MSHSTAATIGHDRSMEDILDRELYTETEAARLLRLAPSTLHWWLEGGERRGRTYRPVLRVEPTGSRSISWAEFIEAGLLRQYRRVHQVPLPQIRRMIDILRERWGAHPLVHEQPYVGPGRRLLVEAQDEAGVAPEYQLVAIVGGQLLLLPPAESFVEKVEWSSDVPVRWRPHADPSSPVRIDPEVRFGKPAVRGISTEVVWEHIEADESFGEVSDQFDLTPDEARWAYAYETSARAA